MLKILNSENTHITIPYKSTHIFLDGDKVVGYGNIFVGDSSVYIGTINAIDKGNGYGRKMVESIKSKWNKNIIGEYTNSAKGFWERMGAIIDKEYDGDFEIEV